MRLLGTAETWLDGQRLLLNRRQTRVLALLMHPEGLSLRAAARLRLRRQAVTLSPRSRRGVPHSAPRSGPARLAAYRLTMPVATDVDLVLTLLRRGRVAAAGRRAYGGDLLPGTNSRPPRDGRYVAVAVRGYLLANPGPTPWSGTASWRRTTPGRRGVPATLAGRPHPAVPLLKGRLAVRQPLTRPPQQPTHHHSLSARPLAWGRWRSATPLAVVTGAGGGLGREIAVALARHRCRGGLRRPRPGRRRTRPPISSGSARSVGWSVACDVTGRPTCARARARALTSAARTCSSTTGGWTPGEQCPAAPYDAWSRTLDLLRARCCSPSSSGRPRAPPRTSGRRRS